MPDTNNTDEPKFPHQPAGTGGLLPHIEALIFASDKPLTSVEITELINNAAGFMDDRVMAEGIDAALEEIVEKYSSPFYPFEVRQSGGGWQFLTKKEFHKTVVQLNGDKFLKRLSAAALETLAIIAYKHPITKGEIETIRGVNSDYTVQKLLEKDLIVISGRNEKLPGQPLVYVTSKTFMDYFGINSTDDLPKIKEVLAEGIVEPTTIHHTNFEEPSTLAVTGKGELIDAEKDIVEKKEDINGVVVSQTENGPDTTSQFLEEENSQDASGSNDSSRQSDKEPPPDDEAGFGEGRDNK